MVNAMESNILPSFMGRPIMIDESLRSNPSMCSPIHILINSSSHYYPNITSNYFPPECPKEERQERLFFENDSIRTTRSGRANDQPHSRFHTDA